MIDYNNGIRYFYDNLAQGEKYMEKDFNNIIKEIRKIINNTLNKD